MRVLPEVAMVGGGVYGVGVRNLAERLAMNAGSESRGRARAVACGRTARAFRFRALPVDGRSTANHLGGTPKKVRW